MPPAPPVEKPVETAQPAPQVERVSHQAEDEPSDSPIGDWQTEGKGTVRIAKCGNALCGFVLGSSNEKGEAILINMKPKTERQWTGGIYSQDSGETYYGTMSMKGINTLRVEACALGRFYCSGNNWSRITRRADSLVTSRQVSADAALIEPQNQNRALAFCFDAFSLREPGSTHGSSPRACFARKRFGHENAR